MAWILFYKRLIKLGGAEVPLGQHHDWLKVQGEEVTVVTFEVDDVERIAIDPAELLVMDGRGTLSQTLRPAEPWGLRTRRSLRTVPSTKTPEIWWRR